MTVRLKVPYGTHKPNDSLTTGAAVETELLLTGRADTGAGVAHTEPDIAVSSVPVSLVTNAAGDTLLADGRSLSLGGSGGTIAAASITDSTAAGRALLTAADSIAQRSALGLGTAATTAATAYATAAQGTKADTAAQIAGDLGGTAATPVVAKINGVAVTGTPTTGQVPTATSGTAATWQTPAGGGGAPGGSDTQPQYNNAGAFGGMAGVTWVTGTSTYTFGGAVVVNYAGATSGNVTLKAPAAAGAAVVTLPSVTDTLAVLGANTYSATQTLSAGDVVTPGTASFANNGIRAGGAAFGVGASAVSGGQVTLWNSSVQKIALVGATGITLSSDGRLRISSTTSSQGAVDLFVGRAAAATLQLGDADSATPVAQTARSQGSRAGTDSNVGGGNLTAQPGTGTGTGAASSLILRSPILVASGTGAQTLVTSLTITQGVAVRAVYTVSGLPTAAAALKGGMAWVTDATLGMISGYGTVPVGGGANEAPVSCNGAAWVIG